jgi:hypothetical protein
MIDMMDRESSAPLRDRFLGSWSLVSVEQVLPSGEVLRPFGDAPLGSLLYQADGYMAAQLSIGNPRKFASDDTSQATTEEAAAAWMTYIGYWGSFEVDAARGVVVHRVEGSWFANWIGTEQIRHFRFEGNDRLILEAPTPAGNFALTWQRRRLDS